MILFAEIDATGWAIIITTAGGQILLITGLILNSIKTWRIAKVADATHTLINSDMSTVLRDKASFARRVADLTGKEADQKLADIAEKALAVHEAKQGMVDRGETTPLEPPKNKV